MMGQRFDFVILNDLVCFFLQIGLEQYLYHMASQYCLECIANFMARIQLYACVRKMNELKLVINK